jgi:hypothetical protein
LLKSFQIKWLDRFNNAFFYQKIDQYNHFIEQKGAHFSLVHEIFAYLDYDDYIILKIFQKNKVIELEYSITNDENQLRTIELNDLKQKSSYGRWIHYYYSILRKSKPFQGDYHQKIQNLFQMVQQEKMKQQSLEKTHLELFQIREKEMIALLEKELS